MHHLSKNLAAAALFLALSAASALASNGRYRDYVIGDRASGMGGAAIAIAQSVDALYYNPSGLTDTTRDSLSLSANLYGFENYRQRSVLYPGEDASSSSYVSIPSAIGGVHRFSDEWVGGFGVFTPDYHRTDLIASKANGNHLYTYSGTDQTLWAGPALAWCPNGDSPWSVGAALFGVFRSAQLTMNIYQGENGMLSHAYDFDDVALMASLGLQYDFGGGWKAGATLQSPNLHVYGSGRCNLSGMGEDTDGHPIGVFSDDVDTDNRQALQLGLGIGRSVPGQYAFGLDVLYHPSTSYHLMKWDFAILPNEVTADVDLEDVVDVSLGGEIYVTEHWPLRAGVFTAFCGNSLPKPGEDNSNFYENDLDLYGITLSIGRETETIGVNLGLEYAFGQGHTMGYVYQEGTNEVIKGHTSSKSARILVSLSTSYYF